MYCKNHEGRTTMHIGGFQKMTMLDYPGRIACILFTHGCNLRCPFCHNATLVTEGYDPVSEEEILCYIRKRRGVLDGVVVSGGEPLLQPDAIPFLRRLAAEGLPIKLDTNGSFPDRLRTVVSEGLVDYVAMDIKNAKEKYPLTTGVPALELAAIEESAAFLLEGHVDYEFRTTIVRELHAEEDMVSIGKWIKGAERYYLQGFVDSGGLIDGEGLHAHPKDIMQKYADVVRPFVKTVGLRGV